MPYDAIKSAPLPLPNADPEAALPMYREALVLVGSTAARAFPQMTRMMALACSLDIRELGETSADALEETALGMLHDWIEKLEGTVFSATIDDGNTLTTWEEYTA